MGEIVKPDSGTIVIQSAAVATGNGTSMPVNEMGTVGLQVLGISGDTLTFEGTVDGTNWVSVLAKNAATGAIAATATANGVYIAPVTGFTEFRARVSTYSAGTITVVAQRIALTTSFSMASVSLVGDVVVDTSALATAAKQDTQITAEQAIQATAGATTGAKVITDANGTLQQYLRGLIYLLITANAQGAQPRSDNGAAWTSAFGVSSAAVVSADITTATAVTDAPASGQKLVIDDIVVSTDTAMSVLFECETTGTDIFKVFLPANGTLQITPRDKVKVATADKKLTAKASVAGNVGITVTYHSEA